MSSSAATPTGVLDPTSPPFNADPTGVRDSTTGLQSWLDALGAAKSGYWPAGKYLISAPLVIQNSGTIIDGAGGATASGDDAGRDQGTVIVLAAGFANPAHSALATGALLLLDNPPGTGGLTAGIRIRDLWIDGRNSAAKVDGVAVRGKVQATQFERVGVHNVGGHGFAVYKGATFTPNGMHFYSCLAQQCGRDGYHGAFDDCEMVDCHAQGCKGDGFRITRANNRFIGCRGDLCVNGWTFDVALSSAGYQDASTLVGCGTQRNNENGLNVINSSASGTAGRLPVVCSGCVFSEDGKNGGSGGGGYAGIHVEGVNLVLLSSTIVTVGTVDVAAGCPQYGLSTAAAGTGSGKPVIIYDTGFLNFQTAAVHDAAPATTLYLGPGVFQGQGFQPSIPAITGLRLARLTGAELAVRAAGSGFGSLLAVTSTTPAPASQPAGFVAAAAADSVLGTRVAGDTNSRWRVDADGRMKWGAGGASAPDCTFGRQAADIMEFVGCDLDIGTAGHGLRVKEGPNARMGTVALQAGVASVATTAVTAASRVYLTSQADGGTPGFLRVSARTARRSFTITSSAGADTSTVAWLIVEPG